MQKKHSSLSVDHLLDEKRRFPPVNDLTRQHRMHSLQEYETLYRRSVDDSEAFWLEQTKTLEWFHPPTQACAYEWDSKDDNIKHTWFDDGIINVSSNCLDRHLNTPIQNKPALIWQGENIDEVRSFTYAELHSLVCRFANVLKAFGIRKGDRVSIYMPLIPETAAAMLACARIGAIHSVVFGGFSAESLAQRLQDTGSKLLITSNSSHRGGKRIQLKEIADVALKDSPTVENVIVVKRDNEHCSMTSPRDHWYHELMTSVNDECQPEPLEAEYPLFILYTSGSTGKPKGVVHTQAGYLLHVSLSHKYVFDLHHNDIYWCTADMGWITGHSYGLYGPLANGATTLMYEGTPTYPSPARFWEIIEKFKVTIFYTAPTVIRTLISEGDEWTQKHDLSSLRVLGTVGEPINPESWLWYYDNIGKSHCPLVDTWWQTETGGIMITPIPGCHTLKPSSASRPFFGVEPIILKQDGTPCKQNEGGALCIKKPWPGIMRTTWGDHDRFIKTYFKTFPDVYFTGDGCREDQEGDYWLMGRIDDVINISGHRIGTAEVESALVSHPAVAEAAVVPIPHEIKGQAIVVYVTLIGNHSNYTIAEQQALKKELSLHVRKEIGPIAVPDKIILTPSLPKTRSGKIMRRVLRKIAEGNIDELGDTSTLADPSVISTLLRIKDEDEG